MTDKELAKNVDTPSRNSSGTQDWHLGVDDRPDYQARLSERVRRNGAWLPLFWAEKENVRVYRHYLSEYVPTAIYYEIGETLIIYRMHYLFNALDEKSLASFERERGGTAWDGKPSVFPDKPHSLWATFSQGEYDQFLDAVTDPRLYSMLFENLPEEWWQKKPAVWLPERLANPIGEINFYSEGTKLFGGEGAAQAFKWLLSPRCLQNTDVQASEAY